MSYYNKQVGLTNFNLDKAFVYALFLANLFLWISIVEPDYFIPKIVKYIISLTVLLIIIYYRINNRKLFTYKGLLRLVIVVFVLWSLFLLLSSPSEQQIYLNLVFSGRYYLIPFAIPLLILFSNFNVNFFSFLFKVSYYLSIVAIILQIYILYVGTDITEWFELYHRILIFQVGSFLLLLISHLYERKRFFVVAFGNNLLLLFILLTLGRRGLALELIILFCLFVLIRTYSSSIKHYYKFCIYFFSVALVFLIIVNFNWIQAHFYVFERGGFTFESVLYSRGRVWEDFFYDFNTIKDWIFGRGLNGTVLRTIALDDIGKTVETGYLYIVLKGGLLYLIPMLFLFLWSAFLGFYKSNNDLAKALSLLIVLHLFNMVSFGLPDYSSQYILLWIAVSTCFSPFFRNISNAEIRLALNGKYMRYNL